MRSRSLVCTLLVVATTFVAAQEDIEPICPGPCPFGEFDEERVISDCVAQCNTTFGDPDAAQACIDACSNWQDSISCTATPMLARRSPNPIERRRRTSSGVSHAAFAQELDVEGDPEAEASDEALEFGEPLERRDSVGACIQRCLRMVRYITICPTNLLTFAGQAGV